MAQSIESHAEPSRVSSYGKLVQNRHRTQNLRGRDAACNALITTVDDFNIRFARDSGGSPKPEVGKKT
jgi:hypothetical protein